MTPIQQQRLIGAGLLVLLVAILAYLVLSKVGQHQTEQALKLPEPIEFSSVIEPIDDGGETAQANGDVTVDADLQQTTKAENADIATNDAGKKQIASESVTSETSTEDSATPPAQPMTRPSVQSDTTAPEVAASNSDQPTVVSETNPSASIRGDRWLIQLGSFSVQENAQSLKADAEKLGYKPYIENSQTDIGLIYRVRLPAMTSRTEADDIAAHINKQLNIKTQVSKQ